MPMLPKCPLRAMSSPMFVSPKPDGVASGRATTDPTVSRKHRRPASMQRSVSAPAEWSNATEKGSEKPRPRKRCVRKFGSPEVPKCPGWAVTSWGKITKATLPTWRLAASVGHGRFFRRSTGRLRREENRADSAEKASSPSYSVALGLRSA